MDRRRAHEPSSDSNDREDAIAQILALCMDKLNAGEPFDEQAIAREHPEFAAELVDDLRVLCRLGSKPSEPRELGSLGDYRLERELGRGGMGIVYEAWQSSMERPVALKVLPAALSADTRALTRFVREARVAGKLKHPNVVQVYAMGVEAETPYYAMELVQGETLAQVLTRLRSGRSGPTGASFPFCGAVDLEYSLAAAKAFAGVAEGLELAHKLGVIHRDIKPSNLIFETDGRLRILDFGLARLSGEASLSTSGDLVGTPLYMSPEQARARRTPIDHRTDIYSLGASLYELLIWRPPFRGREYQETLSQIISREPEAPRNTHPLIPRDLETIVLKCLEKDPDDRYRTAEALAQDLRRVARGDPVEARPRSTVERWTRYARRERRKLIGLGVFAVLIAAVAYLGWERYRDHQLRLEEDYEPLVLAAVEKLHSGSIARGWGIGAAEEIDPTGDWFFDPDGKWRRPHASTVEATIELLDRAIAIRPRRPDARYWRARAFQLLERDGEALAEIDRCLAIDGAFVPARAVKAAIVKRRGGGPGAINDDSIAPEPSSVTSWADAWIAGRRAMEERDWPSAARAFERLVDLDRDGGAPFVGSAVESLMGLALARFQEKSFTAAAEALYLLEHGSPDWHEPALLRGKAYLLAGDPERAEATFRRLHERTERKDEAALGVLSIYFCIGPAEKELEWAEALGDSTRKEVWRMQALCDMGQWENGRKAGLRALEHDPANIAALGKLSWSHCVDGEGDFAGAEKYAREMIRVAPSSCLSRIAAANALCEAGRFEEAARECDAAITLGGSPEEMGNAWFFRGAIAESKGKYADARGLYDEALAISPLHPDAHGKLGFVLIRLGLLDEARLSFDEALRLWPWFSLAHRGQGEVLEARTAIDEAIVAYRAACHGAPPDPWAYAALARLLTTHRGEVKNALELCREGLAMYPREIRIHDVLGTILAERDLGGCESAIESLLIVIETHLKERARRGKFIDSVVIRSYLALSRATKDAARIAAHEALAREIIEARDDTPARDVALDLALAEHESLAGRREAAIERLVTVLRGRPRGLAVPHARRLLTELGGAIEPPPLVALARSLRAQGTTDEALTRLREGLAADLARDADAWDLCLEISFADLELSPADVLASLPSGSDRDANVAAERRWLLDRLARDEPIRFRCGAGGEFKDGTGQVWASDRFYTCGLRYLEDWRGRLRDDPPLFGGEIAATEDDGLYQSERCFLPGDCVAPAYRIPLPRGPWRVRLHFAEIWYEEPGKRVFDVAIEGKMRLEGYEPCRAGFATAEVKAWDDIVVEDGVLDIEFVHRVDNPKIAAIEIHRSD
jgi:serine/threonine protein kinase/Tfp pilus assembly protein PilF